MVSTIISWGLTICLLGFGVYVYRPDLVKRFLPPSQEIPPVISETIAKVSTKKPKAKKGAATKLAGEEKVESASDSQNKKRKTGDAAPQKDTATGASKEQQKDDGLNDKDFAKQLAQTQSGTKLQVPQKQQASKRERRASKLAATSSPEPSGISTEASSTNGRDADDDLTPAESPEAKAVNDPISNAGDVSDMLEAPAPKPTTLRLTDVSTESKNKKPATKAFEPVVSKKKRNEQQRKEEQRLAREESDRLHEAKKQEQLRRARMAAGTSNQTKANNFTAKANAWQSGAPTAVKSASTPTAEPLLDTFDPTASSPAHGAVHTETTHASTANELKTDVGEDKAAAMTASARREGPSTSKKQDYASEMSEEDQIELLRKQNEEDAWESVASKKSKKKGKQQENDSTSGASSPVRSISAAAKVQVNGHKTNGLPKKAEVTNRFDTFQVKTGSGLQDAEWEA